MAAHPGTEKIGSSEYKLVTLGRGLGACAVWDLSVCAQGRRPIMAVFLQIENAADLRSLRLLNVPALGAFRVGEAR